MTAQLEILPPSSSAPSSAIATPGDVVKRLAKMFPKHGSELLEWIGTYQRALGHLSPAKLAEAFETAMAGWTKSTPPRPADIAQHAPKSAAAIGESDGDGLTWWDPAERARKCTRKGHERAREIARDLVDHALRHAPEQLTHDEAHRGASILRDRAFTAAQLEVITGRGQVLELTRDDVDAIRRAIAAAEQQQRQPRAPSEFDTAAKAASDARTGVAKRHRDQLRARADAHRAAFMGEPATTPEPQLEEERL